MRLIERLKTEFNLSGKKAKELINKRLVFVNNQRVWIASYEVTDKDTITVSKINYPVLEPEILYKDSHIIAVNKPPGLLSTGEKKSVESFLRKNFYNINAVHRIDKETSGVLLFSISKEGYEGFLNLFKEKKITKFYLGIVKGNFPESIKIIDEPLDGKYAITKIKILTSNEIASLLLFEIPTGRTHQIRRHLKMKNFFLLGEKEYTRKPERKSIFKEVPRQMLHSWKVRFSHPVTHKTIEITAPIFFDFKETLKALNLSLENKID